MKKLLFCFVILVVLISGCNNETNEDKYITLSEITNHLEESGFDLEKRDLIIKSEVASEQVTFNIAPHHIVSIYVFNKEASKEQSGSELHNKYNTMNFGNSLIVASIKNAQIYLIKGDEKDFEIENNVFKGLGNL
ncbi:MAG TPA: hypothetical protein VGI33_20400 [Paenibacillus sp.]|jgi:hypothetical protein